MLTFLRHILALTFVSSGLLKAVSPDGTANLVRQYAGLFDVSLSPILSFVMAVSLCVLEVALGLMAVRWKTYVMTRPVIVLTLIFFTIITCANAISPMARVESCGCFGEAIHLNYIETLIKNIVLLAIALILSPHMHSRCRPGVGNHDCSREAGKISALLMLALLTVSCDHRLDSALDYAGDNRIEMESVLDHFRNDPNPLKYESAKFLIENMPYHFSLSGAAMARYDSAYLSVAKEPIQFRDSVLAQYLGTIDLSAVSTVSDIHSIDAATLIRAIDNACDAWEHSAWQKDYDKSMFFDYVLPYRILNEQPSDWHQTIDAGYPYLKSGSIRSKRGVYYEAEDASKKDASVRDAISASGGKMTVLDNEQSCLDFTISVPAPSKKNNPSAIYRPS